MAAEILGPKGPLFGPDFLMVDVDDETGGQLSLQIYPDASNPALKKAGLATHYYYLPHRVYLAKKQTSPKDFEFGMTVFKGLMTSEKTIGIDKDVAVTDGDLEIGGGICSFATTMAIPSSIIKKVVQQLKRQDFGQGMPAEPARSNFKSYFDIQGDLEPRLGMVPVLENEVTIEVPTPSEAQGKLIYIHAQGQGKGSIEASGISAFLVTLNQFAAGIVAGALKNHGPPFTVHYKLKEQFYVDLVTISVKVHFKKVHKHISGQAGVGGFLGIRAFQLKAGYDKAFTDNAIETTITMGPGFEGMMTEDLKKFVEQRTQKMIDRAYEILKKELFDHTPIPVDAPENNIKGLAGLIFSGFSSTLKRIEQVSEGASEDVLTIRGTTTIVDTKSGTLTDIQPALEANLDKYLAVIDIGEFFKKIQIVGLNDVSFSPAGTSAADPIRSISIEMKYPDFSNPLNVDGSPNLIPQVEGKRYSDKPDGQEGRKGTAVWTRDNQHELINISTLRLDKSVPGWNPSEVQIEKTIAYDGSDGRVDLKNNVSRITTSTRADAGIFHINADEVGRVFVNFITVPPITSKAISAMLSCTIGNRTDTIRIDKNNSNNVIWEIFSDKFFEETFFSYKVKVTAVSPKFNKPVLRWETPTPVKVDFPTGRIKKIPFLDLELPPTPPEIESKLDEYIMAWETIA